MTTLLKFHLTLEFQKIKKLDSRLTTVFFCVIIYSMNGDELDMAQQKYLCYGDACYPMRLKYSKKELIKHKGKNYCKDCYERQFGASQERKMIYGMVKKLFDLSDYDGIPKFIDLQIDKYIREYGYTEEGIFNTLCYIYFEYDLHELNFRYGIYPVVNEYELHHTFQFKKNVQIAEQKTNKVSTVVKRSNKSVVKKIDRLEL